MEKDKLKSLVASELIIVALSWLAANGFAYMRSDTCRMLNFITNIYVPFLIYDVTCWYGFLN